MNAVLFDTLKFATALQEGDAFSPMQSARLASALSATLESEIATRSDVRDSELRLQAQIAETRTEIAEVELRLTARLADSRTELTTRLADTKADLLEWLVGAIGIQTLAIIVAIFGGVMTLAHLAR
jgi:hypothetical protein